MTHIISRSVSKAALWNFSGGRFHGDVTASLETQHSGVKFICLVAFIFVAGVFIALKKKKKNLSSSGDDDVSTETRIHRKSDAVSFKPGDSQLNMNPPPLRWQARKTEKK
ncbi:hypothetical protein NL108_012384 [Boleophthalmus pectinirostris]|nr:hypothetical protein NL108_012384 [Boleophthalmus pectinirostris]